MVLWSRRLALPYSDVTGLAPERVRFTLPLKDWNCGCTDCIDRKL